MSSTQQLAPLEIGLEADQFDAAVAALATADGDGAGWLVASLTEAVLREVTLADAERLAWVAARVEQLRHQAEESRGEPLPDPIASHFSKLRQDLRLRLAYLDQQEYQAGAEAEAETVKERIFDLLVRRERLRPRDVCRELELTPPQVSRALRQLAADGRVARSSDPMDQRAAWYEPAEASEPPASALSDLRTANLQVVAVLQRALSATELRTSDSVADLLRTLQDDAETVDSSRAPQLF